MKPKELEYILKNKSNIQLLDVREPFERIICYLKPSLDIPIGQIVNRLDEVPKNTNLIVYCHYGVRSAMVVEYLQKNGYDNVYNLEGGIDRWAVDVEPRMRRY